MAAINAIDFHVHPMSPEALGPFGGGRLETLSRYFGRDIRPTSMGELAEQYRNLGMMAVLLATDDSTTSGLPPVPNDHVAEAVHTYPDVFVGFAGVDPWKGRLAVEEAVRAKQELGLRGLKFNPGRQRFFPNDPRFDPLWDAAEQVGLICLFHTGMMGNGAGSPGGLGFKLKYTQPLLVDDVAAEHPALQIVMAHPGWPWQAEQLAVARHKGNVYIDLSGWSPKYFPSELVQHLNTLLQDKCLFGSDWPVLTPERWIEDFEKLPIKDGVREKILLRNAERLLGL
jgi:predicted TIM-barrel fold metal-dependent hydrolase